MAEPGCESVAGDLRDEKAIREPVQGCDAVFHVAARYEVGIPPSARSAMWEDNVAGTERVLSAAEDAGVTRIVHVSTGNVFGNTHGKVADETYHRDEAEGFVSVYDETKYRAHRLAEEHMAKGAPVLIAIPGGVYGPGDTSAVGKYIELFLSGRMRMMMFPEAGFNLAHGTTSPTGSCWSTTRGGSASRTRWGRDRPEPGAHRGPGEDRGAEGPAPVHARGPAQAEHPVGAGDREAHEPGAGSAGADQHGGWSDVLVQRREGSPGAGLHASGSGDRASTDVRPNRRLMVEEPGGPPFPVPHIA
jgi:NAD dependent epimerase/dehydratase family